jgi:hypothetical protein
MSTSFSVNRGVPPWLTRSGVTQFKVFICKLVAKNGLSASPIPLREVTSLDHKVLDDTVETRPLIAKALLAPNKYAHP